MATTSATEIQATAVVLIGVTVAIVSTGNSELIFLEPLTLWLGLLAVVLLALFDSSNGKNFRRNAASGFLCCPLLPLCTLLSKASARDNSKSVTDPYDTLQMVFLEGSFIISLVVMCHMSMKQILEKKKFSDCGILLVISLITTTVSGCVLIWKAWNLLDPVKLVVCLDALFLQFFLHHSFPVWLPRSFTLGEAAIVSQGCALFCISAGIQYFRAWQQLERGNSLAPSLQATLFVQTAVLSAAAALVILFLVPCFRSTVGYYILVPGVAATFSLPLLFLFFSQDFVTWCFDYITGNSIKIYLFCYWFICCIVAVAIVYFDTSSIVQISTSKKKNVKFSHHVSSAVRKHFHLLASAILLPGLLLDVEILFMAASCAFVVLLMLESLRVLLIAPFGETLHQYLQVFVDERDEGPVILTHIYLLIGCSIPVWIHYPPVTHFALYSGLLSLGIGDTVASLAGLKFGCHKWKGTKKTVEGTICAILSQFAFIILLHVTGVLAVPWMKCIIAIIFTSLLEAFTTQIDNLLLPLFMYMLLV